MNKVFIGIFIAVIVLGMALIMLSERLERKPGPPPVGMSMPAGSSTATGVPEPPSVLMPEAFLPPLPASSEPSVSTPPAQPELPILLAEEIQTPPTTPTPVTEEAAAKPGTVSPAEQTAQKPEADQAHEPEPVAPPPSREASEDAKRRQNADKPQKVEAAKAVPASRASLDRFVVFAREGGATVRMTGSSPIRYSYMNLDNPPRLVIDLEGDWKMTAPGVPGNPLVSKVRVGKTQGKSRVVIDLKAKPRKLRMVHSGDHKNLDVRLDQ